MSLSLRELALGQVPRRGKSRPTLLLVEWPEHGGMTVKDVGEMSTEELLWVKNEMNRMTAQAMWREGKLKKGRGRTGTVRVKPEA